MRGTDDDLPNEQQWMDGLEGRKWSRLSSASCQMNRRRTGRKNDRDNEMKENLKNPFFFQFSSANVHPPERKTTTPTSPIRSSCVVATHRMR